MVIDECDDYFTFLEGSIGLTGEDYWSLSRFFFFLSSNLL